MKLRYLSLVLVLLAALLATGTGAFTSVNGDRGMAVSVASDQRAMLGVDIDETDGVVGGDSFTVLDLIDNFSPGTSVQVTDVSVPSSAPIAVAGDSAGSALPAAVDDTSVEATCEETADDQTVTVTVTVEGDGLTVTKHKEVPVTCEERDVTFDRCGQVESNVAIDERIYENSGQGNSGNGKLVAVIIDGDRIDNPNSCSETPEQSNSQDSQSQSNGQG